MRTRHYTFACYLAACIVLCDQMSKWWVRETLQRTRHALHVSDFLNMVLVWNHGVTFGLMNHFNPKIMPWVLGGTAFLILVFLARWLWRTHSTVIALSLGAIMGGAVGNIIDRIRFGAVIDFLDFHYGECSYCHWYAFNVADAAIVTGVCVLVLDSLVRGR